MQARTQRPYDLILVGASGFVGKLATMHLLERYGAGPGAPFKWALSARSSWRLERTHGEIAKEVEHAEALSKVPVIYGDCDDEDFAQRLAGQARVVAASLAPYSLHGSKLVAACVAQGTHYVDISGEMLWIRGNIDRHHAAAAQKGVRVVHACGLGSVPADLSALIMLRRLEKDHVTPHTLKFMMGPIYSSLGGGSMTSYATLVATAKDEGKIRGMLDPHLLAAPELAGKTKQQHGLPLRVAPKAFGGGFDRDVGRWTAPLWLAALDDEVVARSAALLGYPPQVTYIEAQTYSPTLFGLVSAWFTFLAAYAMAALLYLAPTRWLLTTLRPPGSGPNRYIRERGYGKAFLVAKGTSKGGGEVVYRGEFDMPNGDPGYQETAKMLVEAALCLVLEEARLPRRGGVLTPAAAFDEVLMERLAAASNMACKI